MTTIIIGSGIIGLTTAIRILESHSPNSDKEVHIIASRLPTDQNPTKDPEYASACAGAHHLSFAADDDERQARWDRRSESSFTSLTLLHVVFVAFTSLLCPTPDMMSLFDIRSDPILLLRLLPDASVAIHSVRNHAIRTPHRRRKIHRPDVLTSDRVLYWG